MSDVVVIGAGIAGLTCAKQLQQAGYSVVVVDKSRGVGGRVATRRLHGTVADHGACYLKPQGELVQKLVEVLRAKSICRVWTDTVYEMGSDRQLQPGKQYPRYVAPMGMSAIAKFLATDLDIRFNQRVQAINPTDKNTWHFTFDATDEISKELTAAAVVVAIPAPQALMLLEPLVEATLSSAFLDSLRSVEFYPSLSVMAGYSGKSAEDLGWKAITFTNDSHLGWIGLDSSKRLDSQSPVFVLQSSAEFANRYLDAEDLNSAAREMLSRAAELLIPWLDSPDWFQIHLWRYAFPSRPLDRECLDAATTLPLVCCGDWCGGNLIESAMNSGLAAAVQINSKLQHLPLSGDSFWEAIA